MSVLRSRDNPRIRRWRKLADDARYRRSERRALIEGAHLVSAYLERIGAPVELLVREGAIERPEIAALVRRAGLVPVVLADNLFRAVADTESPSGLAAEIALPPPRPDSASSTVCVFLDGVQDAGNVGAILRSAAAFGAGEVFLSADCADPWSPKVLRAAMGGHFFLEVVGHADLAHEIDRFGAETVCAVPRGGRPLHECRLAGRIGWVFGAEGRGVSEPLGARISMRVTIPMPGGMESLNVGAAAAICLYESLRQRLAGQ